MLKTSDFDYKLPEELIAQNPMEKRDESRLLYYKRSEDKIEHRKFGNLPEILCSGDVLVINESKVIPARLHAHIDLGHEPQNNQEKMRAEAKNEVFLIKKIDENTWEVLAKPARRLALGVKLIFSEKLHGEVMEEMKDGMRKIKFSLSGAKLLEAIEEIGETPLPPYIKHSTAKPEQYQTVYAQKEGSVAAPTAGLHFTPEIFARLKEKGIEVVRVILHVGWGTFAPVKSEFITEHEIHSEFFEISPEAVEKINLAKNEGRRVIAVGTTSVRVLESSSDENGLLKAQNGETRIFIYPGYKFRCIDGLVTNFHLPKSSLIMLTSAFVGRERNLEIYQEAIAQRYRFFSFGDACLFL